jgi:hypothetical protein
VLRYTAERNNVPQETGALSTLRGRHHSAPL